MYAPSLVAFPPGSSPDEPLSPLVAVAHVLPVVCDETLGVAEVREVESLRRPRSAAAVGRGVHAVAGGLITRHAGGDLRDLLRLERRNAALGVRNLQGCEYRCLSRATASHASCE